MFADLLFVSCIFGGIDLDTTYNTNTYILEWVEYFFDSLYVIFEFLGLLKEFFVLGPYIGCDIRKFRGGVMLRGWLP